MKITFFSVTSCEWAMVGFNGIQLCAPSSVVSTSEISKSVSPFLYSSQTFSRAFRMIIGFFFFFLLFIPVKRRISGEKSSQNKSDGCFNSCLQGSWVRTGLMSQQLFLSMHMVYMYTQWLGNCSSYYVQFLGNHKFCYCICSANSL